jgi:hypothetical protein
MNHVNQHFQNFYTKKITNKSISSQPSSIRGTLGGISTDRQCCTVASATWESKRTQSAVKKKRKMALKKLYLQLDPKNP